MNMLRSTIQSIPQIPARFKSGVSGSGTSKESKTDIFYENSGYIIFKHYHNSYCPIPREFPYAGQ